MKAIAQFLGRVVRDPESKKVGESQLTTLSVAVNRKVKGGENQASFFDLEAWGQQGDYITQYAKKGDVVYCDAEIKIDSYQDKEGNPRKATKYMIKPYTFGFVPSGAPKGIAQDNSTDADSPF